MLVTPSKSLFFSYFILQHRCQAPSKEMNEILVLDKSCTLAW